MQMMTCRAAGQWLQCCSAVTPPRTEPSYGNSLCLSKERSRETLDFMGFREFSAVCVANPNFQRERFARERLELLSSKAVNHSEQFPRHLVLEPVVNRSNENILKRVFRQLVIVGL